MKHRIVVAVTGASGSIYARQLLGKLAGMKEQLDEVAIVMTENARTVWETELEDRGFEQLPFRVFSQHDFHAPFASGSGRFNTMIICPCSMGTLGRIAGGISNDLITRAADVVLKERRKLICVLRDTPYNLVHIRNMQTVTEAGGIICPATPSFYSKPKTIEEVAATVVDRVIDLAGLEQDTFRWGA
ncbi:UbiX family flavin prenyltransferase [Chitinophaga sp. XS-30]|uniref:UbiX family flavin prenyltransferase n=1 Tax=Chitinophaga sp. XS-30 TaxID=2604421 RepID=UPI0011DD769D|nr:UbiX family flavin prenyltransferase [Chitinophaga sp. XS-30]QEH43365.1 UbiX family flavin prenyltransferase [Chitinophaga sp. XS-30]